MVAAAEVGHRLNSLQFCILVAIPLVGILANTALVIHLSGTMNTRFAGFESKMESRFERMESRFERVDARFDTLMGKVVEIDNRLSYRGPDGNETVRLRAMPIRHKDANDLRMLARLSTTFQASLSKTCRTI